MDNVKEKIRKLLAKATSQNEHEAQAALLKARELMAKYKLTEKEIGDAPSANKELKKTVYSEEAYTSKRNTWFNELSKVIAENHCCANIATMTDGSIKRYVTFAGVDDDADIAMEMFTYAVRHIKDRIKKERKKINQMYEWQEDRNVCVRRFENGYAYGFVKGLSEQYEEQFAMMPDNESMAIVMVMPQEVKDYLGTLRTRKFRIENRSKSLAAYDEGYNAGYGFSPVKQLAGKTEAV